MVAALYIFRFDYPLCELTELWTSVTFEFPELGYLAAYSRVTGFPLSHFVCPPREESGVRVPNNAESNHGLTGEQFPERLPITTHQALNAVT